jgi:gelsolin
LNPEYNENFFLFVSPNIVDEEFPHIPLLNISVYDWDRLSKNDFIGSCTVELRSLEPGIMYKKYITLRPSSNGSIEFTVTARNMPASVMATPRVIKCAKPNSSSMLNLTADVQKKLTVTETPPKKHKRDYSIDLKNIAAVQSRFEESNIAAIGSQDDIESRVVAAKTEKAWEGAGKQVGIEIWRIEKFTVQRWPKEMHGTFYDGDSYIVLNTYTNPENQNQFFYDAHFWLGLYSTQDEIGTAAYKTVELDDLLGSLPVEHREVQGSETERFLSYFPTLEVMNGGVDTGFNAVNWREKLTSWEPRLLWVKGKGSNIQVRQVPLQTSSLNSGDVFALDLGLKVLVWKGKSSSKAEQFKATQLCSNLQNERGTHGDFNYFFIEEENYQNTREEHEFFAVVKGNKDEIRTADEGNVVQLKEKTIKAKLFVISDSTGTLVFNLIAEKNIKKDMLDSMDVFLLDVSDKVFIWIGKNASVAERKSAMVYASLYAKEVHLPLTTPIVRIVEGRDHEEFNSYLH